MDTTFDGFLNKQIIIEQPKIGFRIAVDTLLLASAVPACAQEYTLDIGCGVGGAMLALCHRVPMVKIKGLEIQEEMVVLCQRNILLNKMEQNLSVTLGAVASLPHAWDNMFDHVMMNPPYHAMNTHDVSPCLNKKLANAEPIDMLKQWIESAAKALKSMGVLTLIHRYDRYDEIQALLHCHFNSLKAVPIMTKHKDHAKRIIVRAQKARVNENVVLPPLVMHQENGKYTQAAEDILRYGKALVF